MFSGTPLCLFGTTPLLFKPRYPSGVNQYGMKPETTYDFRNPTNLVNYGRGTSFDTLNVRRAPSGVRNSAPSMHGLAVTEEFTRFLGLVPDDPNALTFCQSETTALRMCMAKGQSTCEREDAALAACMGQVGPLRRALSTAGRGFKDWYIQNVSDNYTKPQQHRTQDWKHHYAQEKQVLTRRQMGKAYGRHPKRLAWNANVVKEPGFARRSRLTVNK